jgi:hypothetical protein
VEEEEDRYLGWSVKIGASTRTSRPCENESVVDRLERCRDGNSGGEHEGRHLCARVCMYVCVIVSVRFCMFPKLYDFYFFECV